MALLPVASVSARPSPQMGELPVSRAGKAGLVVLTCFHLHPKVHPFDEPIMPYRQFGVTSCLVSMLVCIAECFVVAQC